MASSLREKSQFYFSALTTSPCFFFLFFLFSSNVQQSLVNKKALFLLTQRSSHVAAQRDLGPCGLGSKTKRDASATRECVSHFAGEAGKWPPS